MIPAANTGIVTINNQAVKNNDQVYSSNLLQKRIFKLIDCPDCKGCTTGVQDEHNNCIQV